MGRVLDRAALRDAVRQEQRAGRKIVFTNGCFDILHAGHARSLGDARALGDRLVVGVNSDASFARLGKGADRPIVAEAHRAELVAALGAVDYVSIFDEDTPLALIRAVEPDVLAKGGDWAEDDIVGGDFVKQRGGRVVRLPYHTGLSTTEILRRIKN
jgi:D-beta-D-heptose 7-phosphate kinase/D-beta-D-heptose 1-phosphate adenosyltransferase